MATYNIYTKALDILKKRELYYGEQAHKTTNHVVTQMALSEASAYNSAWWILYYAIHENWECLDQFDYFETEGENINEELA